MRSNQSSSSRGPPLGRGRAQAEQLADQDEVLGAGEVLVDRRVLAGEADGPAHLVGLGRHVVAADPRDAGVRLQQGRQDAHGGGLAGAVGTEDAQHGAGGHRQRDAVQGLGVAEALA